MGGWGIMTQEEFTQQYLIKMPLAKRVARIDPATPNFTVNTKLAWDLFGDHPGWSMTNVLVDRLSIILYDINLLDHPMITAGIMSNQLNVVYGFSRGPMFTTISWDKNNV